MEDIFDEFVITIVAIYQFMRHLWTTYHGHGLMVFTDIEIARARFNGGESDARVEIPSSPESDEGKKQVLLSINIRSEAFLPPATTKYCA